MIEIRVGSAAMSRTWLASSLSIDLRSGVSTEINVWDTYFFGSAKDIATAATAPANEHTSTVLTKLQVVICILNAPQRTSTTSPALGLFCSSSASYSAP